jgi:metal-responsive CopG/Arc/MetJ family transcriptional regulator
MEAKMQTATIPEQQRGTPVQVRLHQKLLQAIEKRRGQESIPSRPEAIRRLLQRSLATPPPPAQS